jgi:ribosomal protein S18 acetylase RimI-like enzyme
MTELNEGEGQATTIAPEEMARALFAENREVKLQALVAQQGGVCVGALLYYPGYDTLTSSEGYHLADIIITEHCRKQGMGRALMQALAAKTLADEKQWLSLTVLKRNEAARAFYAALGMTQVEVDFFAMGKKALMKVRV